MRLGVRPVPSDEAGGSGVPLDGGAFPGGGGTRAARPVMELRPRRAGRPTPSLFGVVGADPSEVPQEPPHPKGIFHNRKAPDGVAMQV